MSLPYHKITFEYGEPRNYLNIREHLRRMNIYPQDVSQVDYDTFEKLGANKYSALSLWTKLLLFLQLINNFTTSFHGVYNKLHETYHQPDWDPNPTIFYFNKGYDMVSHIKISNAPPPNLIDGIYLYNDNYQQKKIKAKWHFKLKFYYFENVVLPLVGIDNPKIIICSKHVEKSLAYKAFLTILKHQTIVLYKGYIIDSHERMLLLKDHSCILDNKTVITVGGTGFVCKFQTRKYTNIEEYDLKIKQN